MPTPVSPTGDSNIDGVLWGWRWDSTDLTVSFPTTAAPYAGYTTIENFTPFSVFQTAQIVDYALTNLAGLTNLTFTIDPSGFGDLRFGQATGIDYGPTHFNPGLHAPGDGSAEANPPDPYWTPDYAQGDSWFTTGVYANPVLGSFQYAAGLLHEVGHSLGLKHGHSAQFWSNDTSVVFPALPAYRDSQEFSVMTYRSYIGMDLTDQASGQEEYPWTFMMNDYAALQYMYGANFGAGSNNTDTIYTFNPTTGEMSVNGVGNGASYNAKILLTIWDGGGTDLFDFSNYTNDQNINLEPGAFSTFSSDQLANLSNGQAGPANYARGNVANPLLYQGDLRSLIENLNTGAGDDFVIGNQAANSISSGAGDDTVRGREGDDNLDGESGDDWLSGGAGNDSLRGGFGDDTLLGGEGNDTLWSANGEDSLSGGAGDDRVSGGTGNDTVSGGEGNDSLRGGFGDDTLLGGEGDDTLRGENGVDWLTPGAGNDTVDGGTGLDMVSLVDLTQAAGRDGAAGPWHGYFRGRHQHADRHRERHRHHLRRFHSGRRWRQPDPRSGRLRLAGRLGRQ